MEKKENFNGWDWFFLIAGIILLLVMGIWGIINGLLTGDYQNMLFGLIWTILMIILISSKIKKLRG